MRLAADAIEYYDTHVDGKIRDFVDGNRRVDKAWRTIERWMPPAPQRVLEIGCGLGATSWRIARRWPDAEVFATDTSGRSIECGGQLFREPNLTFACRSIDAIDPGDGWDAILLIDVYEHIPAGEREQFNRHLKRLLRKGGRILLTFPTVRHQEWSRTKAAHTLQPVDEDVDITAIAGLAAACALDILIFKVVSVWNGGDYAHAVLGITHHEEVVPLPAAQPPTLGDRLAGKWPGVFRPRTVWPSRPVRLAMIERTLGAGAYSQR